ncbi:MAG: glycine cleavage system protein H [Desulfobaccales bacterium]
MSIQNNNRERPQMKDVFGFQVPTSTYYLHGGHAWAVPESSGQVRVGLDDFSQKILGPADELKLPDIGKVYYQDHIFMAQIRQRHKAPFLAPVDGTIETINSKVVQTPRLIHDDPYGEGWLFLVNPTNLQRNQENLLSGEANAAWIDQESHRLLDLMETAIGVTLPDGGAIVDDVYGHYPALGWRPLVQDFFLPILTRTWKRKGEAALRPEAADQDELKREVFRVLNRTSDDREFYRTLMDMQPEALEAYKLSSEAKTAILSGDLQWLNEHIGELTQKQLRFVLSCLLPGTMAQKSRG